MKNGSTFVFKLSLSVLDENKLSSKIDIWHFVYKKYYSAVGAIFHKCIVMYHNSSLLVIPTLKKSSIKLRNRNIAIIV